MLQDQGFFWVDRCCNVRFAGYLEKCACGVQIIVNLIATTLQPKHIFVWCSTDGITVKLANLVVAVWRAVCFLLGNAAHYYYAALATTEAISQLRNDLHTLQAFL